MTKKCVMCKATNPNPLLKVCGYRCASKWLKTEKGMIAKERSLLRLQRNAERQRKVKDKGVSHWLKQTRLVAQEYAARRDQNKQCISCGKYLGECDGQWLTRWDGGHYKTVGGHPEMQLDLNNINGQCRKCNSFEGGRVKDQEERIVQRFGQARLVYLNTARPKTFTIEYLARYRRVIRRRMKRFK